MTCAPRENGSNPVTSTALTWNRGRPQKSVLPHAMPSPRTWATLHALATSFAWRRIAIFGVPVVPPVQKKDDGSSGAITRPLTSRSVGWRPMPWAKS
jgi:hypothetical protein